MQTIEIQDFHSFLFEDHLLLNLVPVCIVIVLKHFEDLILFDDKLLMKTAKLHPSKFVRYMVFAQGLS